MQARVDNAVLRENLPKFSSESLLQQAIAGLLARMPGVSGVQILHGAQEFGKDIIFQSGGPFGEPLTCACVVKNKKINGKVTDNASARAIFNQIEEALDTPFLDGSGEAKRVHRVYVISPEEIAQSTMYSISGKLASRAGQVVFIGSTQLFHMFRKHWLDFFSDEYASLESYMARLSRDASYNPLISANDLYNIGSISESEITIYVGRLLFREAEIIRIIDLVDYMEKFWHIEWYRVDIDHLVSEAEELTRLLDYLKNWDFYQEDLRDSAAIELRKLAEEISKVWLKKADSLISGADSSLNLMWGSVRINLTKEFRKAKLKKIVRDIVAGLKLLAEACEVTRKLPGKSRDVSVLADPDWQLASVLGDCLRYAPMTICSTEPGVRVEFTESEIFNYPGHVLVVGAAGYGKTSFCRWHALADAERFRASASRILPVFIPLNALPPSLDNFEEAFLRGVGRSALLNDSGLRQATQVRLYLDGLDEVSSDARRRQIIDLVRRGPSDSTLDFQAIITSRDYVVGKWLAGIPRLELREFTEVQVEEFKSQWLVNFPHLRSELERQMNTISTLEGLMKVPLLATLIILVFRQTGNLPESRTRLYSIFIDLLSGGWDLSKNVLRESRFGRVPKTMVLSDLAASAQAMRARYFSASDVDAATQRVIQRDKDIVQAMREELIADGVISRTGDQFFFSHLSFQEFLAAKNFFGDPNSKEINRIVNRFIAGDDWWREVVRFYIGLSENPSNMVQWLISACEKFKEAKSSANDLFFSVTEFFPNFDLPNFVRRNARAAWLKELAEGWEV